MTFLHSHIVFVTIELGSRRIVRLGVTTNPTDQWTARQLCEDTSLGDGPHFLIRDSDSTYGQSLAYVASDIEVLKTPQRAPRTGG